MKRFKTIFYPVYLIVIVLVLLIAFNIYDSLELFKRWGWYRYFSDLPIMGRNLLVFLCLLMTTEIAIENFSLIGSRSKVKKLNREIESLKAKLYDKSQNTTVPEEETLPEEEDDDEQ